jgi:uncharacterized OsmC-like protein
MTAITEGAETVRAALERNARAVEARPSVGQGTAVTRVRLEPGLTCEVVEGPWSFTVGMTEKYGGANAGPNPGVYGRGAVGSCIAIGYGMWAARLGVPIDALEVEVQADYDARGELGVSPEVRPGYLAMRYIVTVESTAPTEEILRVLDAADRCSSWRDDIMNGVPLTRDVRVIVPES